MRRVRRKVGNKEKVFGCDLLEHLNATSQEVPLVLRCCSEFVEKHGIVDGIYRLSGVSSNIQKLRNDFESDGSPDLNKDVYLQDIHCVSSLCKAYFRELPNPLLTYQLYDKFAEAVAIQLEEERLVKIRDVLKDLPTQHYRTLEFLMRHLVRVASFSSETNMHARNLAIVWAPNLLRSKDIEVSGFNGTAAFMEVRVQSIVVEFILTHVSQLFPDQDVSTERRNSLPSPTAASCRDEGPFRPVQSHPIANYGHISPGDGPIPIRPYHAIIEGTDKRKGSLKGRKWMSIFNIGGRFPDPRRRHKHSAKEKERPVLRPARSMDSLSTPSYPNEGSRRSAQRPPSNNMSTSPLVTHSSQCASDVAVSTGALGGSEYAVTYRRGTGLVSGGTGTQGTYTALDPDGTGLTGTEVLLSRSPGLTTKVGRRAAMHITGPTLVTVPLHITSNLALGVLQGGGADRVIHRGREREGGERVDGKEGGEKEEEKKESRVMEEGRKVQEKEINHMGEVRDKEEAEDTGGSTEAVGGEEEEAEGQKEEEEEKEEVGKECTLEAEPQTGDEDPPREQRTNSVNSNTEEDNDEDADYEGMNVDVNSDYMVMRGMKHPDDQPEETQRDDDDAFDASDALNSTEVGDDLGLSGYVQDNFEFLDQMDCSVLDHMDCSVPYQVNEFSVEPPGHSDDEYEVMEQARSYCSSAEPQTDVQPAETHTQSQTELKPHRPLSLDLQSRHTKSLSLPYMTSPVHGPDELSSEDDVPDDVSDDYLSDEDESMFVKSLPPDFFLSNMTEFESHVDTKDTSDEDPAHQLKSSEDLLNAESSACKEMTAGDEEQVEVKEDEGGVEEKEIEKKEDEEENKRQSIVTEDDHTVSDDAESDKEESVQETSTCRPECPVQIDGESSSVADVVVQEEPDDPHSDSPPCHEVSNEESGDFSVETTEQTSVCVTELLEVKENDENVKEEATEEDSKVIADQTHEEKTSSEIWDELEDVICEVIEDEETKLQEQSPAEEGDTSEDVKPGEEEEEEEEEQTKEVLGEQINEGGTDETEVRIEEEEESVESGEEKLTDTEVQEEVEDNETDLPKTRELDEATQRKYIIDDEAQHRDREEVVSREKEKKDEERDEQHSTPPSEDKQLNEAVKVSEEDRKCEESDISQRGVGRNLVVSKQPKIYQVKAVPVVPPKPQHCKITALTLRQQQQQRERRDADRERENLLKVPVEQDRVCPGEEDEGKKEKPALRGGETERERRRDGDESPMRNTNRNSPLSMCFDEAVAIATMRREREKECEKEKERQRERGNEVQ